MIAIALIEEDVFSRQCLQKSASHNKKCVGLKGTTPYQNHGEAIMSGEPRSPVEEALENQPFGALQLRVVLLCALVQAFDGFDLGTIGMAAPSLSKAWGVRPPLL